MGLSIWQLAIVIILFLLLFGRGKLPALMSDLAEGIKNFRTGLNDDSDAKKEISNPEALETLAKVKAPGQTESIRD